MVLTDSQAARGHAVIFYVTDRFLVDRIAEFVGEGLAAGERVLAVATNAHWTDVAERLDERGVSHGRAAEQGRLVVVDAEWVLDHITVDGNVSADRFREMLLPLLNGSQQHRIYGEVVGLLAARGDIDAAVMIEKMGHQLSRDQQIPILCAYCARGEYALSDADVSRLTDHHHHSVREDAALGTAGGHFHAVRFYRDSDGLTRLVAKFLAEGFAARLPAIVVATPEHRDAVFEELRARSFDVDGLAAAGDLILLDAAELLAEFMVDGMPDPRRFRRAIMPVIDKACKGRTDCVVRVYGEMVDVLWKSGQTAAATRLEMLWNDLAHTQSFALLCGYSMGSFYKNAAQQEICGLHTHVVSDAGHADAVN